MESENAVLGDNSPIDLPETQVDERDLRDEKSMARFSKSAEFKRLKDYLEGRIDFFQHYLPDGRPLKSDSTTSVDWIIANTVIGEFKNVLEAYERAAEAVKSAS